MKTANDLRYAAIIRIVLMSIFVVLAFSSIVYASEVLLSNFLLGLVPFLLGLWMLTRIRQTWKALDIKDLL